jgi:hypothetical protein
MMMPTRGRKAPSSFMGERNPLETRCEGATNLKRPAHSSSLQSRHGKGVAGKDEKKETAPH